MNTSDSTSVKSSFPFDVKSPRLWKEVPPGLGEEMRKLRVARGFTQAQLAEHLGVTVRTIHRWEKLGDAILLENAAMVFQALGVRAVLVLTNVHDKSVHSTLVPTPPDGATPALLQHEEELPAVVDLIEDGDDVEN